VLARYEAEGSIPVEPDLERIRALGVIPVEAELISEEDVVRHDSASVARALMRLLVAGAAVREPAVAQAR
jgi:hypothetical protein